MQLDEIEKALVEEGWTRNQNGCWISPSGNQTFSTYEAYVFVRLRRDHEAREKAITELTEAADERQHGLKHQAICPDCGAVLSVRRLDGAPDQEGDE